MSRCTTLTVRVDRDLADFVAARAGSGRADAYIRDLIRRDRERAETEAFGRLKAELAQAFAVPETSYKPLSAAEVIARNRV